jgi:chromosomal replication initiation ATPase DnaA
LSQARQGGAPFRLAAQVAEDPLLLLGRSSTGKTFLLMHGVSVDRDATPRQAFLSNHVTKRC